MRSTTPQHRLTDLTVDQVGLLPNPCRSCAFWEVDGAPQGEEQQRGRMRKGAWLENVASNWGRPGKLVMQDDEAVGYVLWAPPRQVPRTRRMPQVPSTDALLLTVLWVHPDQRGSGVGTALVHALLRDLPRHRARALECYGARRATPSCFVPEGFLLSLGFTVLHEHPSYPLLRLDLRQTARWQQAVERALGDVRSLLGGREEAPAPARTGAS